jgi:hypothetical protein
MDGTARYGPRTADLERLLEDTRVLGPSGIERIAWGWRRYEDHELGAVDPAAETARQAIHEAGLGPAWEAVEEELRRLTHGHDWQAEDVQTGRTAAEAARHAGMALLVRDAIDHQQYRHLVKAMSEALPWLLPEELPDTYRERR